MAKTYADYLTDIERLKEKAEEVRRKEIAGVVGRIKEAIAHYGLTAADLGLGGAAAAAPVARQAGAKAAKKSAAAAPVAKYADGFGHSWSGRGPKPGWLKAALQAGRTLEELTHAGGTPFDTAAEKAQKGPRAGKKVAVAAKYKDDAGHSWSGRGPKPKWLKEALDAGKTLEELTA